MLSSFRKICICGGGVIVVLLLKSAANWGSFLSLSTHEAALRFKTVGDPRVKGLRGHLQFKKTKKISFEKKKKQQHEDVERYGFHTAPAWVQHFTFPTLVAEWGNQPCFVWMVCIVSKNRWHGAVYPRIIVLVWFYADLCVCVCACVHVCSPLSPRHGWTGRVWSHERTIHEDRGGLPARLLRHRQRKVSDAPHPLPLHSLLASAASLLHVLCAVNLAKRSLSLVAASCFRRARAVDVYYCFLLLLFLFSPSK